MKYYLLLYIISITPLLSKPQCIEKNINNSIEFSIRLVDSINDYKHPEYSKVEIKLINNSKDTITFLDVESDDYSILTLENPNMRFGNTDFGNYYLLAKKTLPPFTSLEKKIIVMYLTYKPNRPVGRFRIGYKYNSIDKNKKIQTKVKKLNLGTNIIWSNYLEIK